MRCRYPAFLFHPEDRGNWRIGIGIYIWLDILTREEDRRIKILPDWDQIQVKKKISQLSN